MRAFLPLVTLACLACAAAPPVAPSTAGPKASSRPAGAAVAKDAAELRAMLSDPAGPTDIWLRPAVYRGDWTVRRPVHLHGAGPATVLEGSGKATVLDVRADAVVIEDVVVRNSGNRFTAEDAGIRAQGKGIGLRRVAVDGTLFGITLAQCPSCTVVDSVVRGRGDELEMRGDGIKIWESPDAQVLGCTVEFSRDVVVWYSRRVVLADNDVRDCRYGTHFMYAHDAVVRNSRLRHNIVGIFVMYSERMRVEGNLVVGARGAAGMGLGFKDSDGVRVTGNRLVGNTTGVYLDRSPRSPDRPVVLEGNQIALNGTGLRLHGNPDGVVLRGNDLQDDGDLLQVEGGGDALSMTCEGNSWSDYAGYDLDGDGTGDVAFEVKQLTSALTDAHPQARWFQATVAMTLLDTVARALPLLAQDVLLRDPRPAMAARGRGP